MIPENPLTARLLFKILHRLEDHLGLAAVVRGETGMWVFTDLKYEVQVSPVGDVDDDPAVAVKVYRKNEDGTLTHVPPPRAASFYHPGDMLFSFVEQDVSSALQVLSVLHPDYRDPDDLVEDDDD